MREIKFRAWVKKGLPFGKSGMCKVRDLISIQNGIEKMHSIYVEIEKEISPYKDQDYWQIWKDDFELMQFTGLHDKNGKEIYEGDIVKFDKYEWYRSPVRTKKDIDKLPEYYEEVTFDHIGVHISESDLNTYCEVVGNKFENPELFVLIKYNRT